MTTISTWMLVLLASCVAFLAGTFTQKLENIAATQSNASMAHVVRKDSIIAPPPPPFKDDNVNNARIILPDWRMTTDCSIYSRDCVLRRLNERKYGEYPFRFAERFEGRYEWREKLPEGWKESLREHAIIPSPPRSPAAAEAVPLANGNSSVMECVAKARNRSVDEQLDELLSLLTPVEEIDMVSFTISDYLYAHDMIQDVFEMAANVIGFKDAFFMVAMDVDTMKLACHHDYPFLAWPQQKSTTQEEGTLKANVANSKFVLSHALAKRRQSFLFFEMDVWWIQSPVPALKEQAEDILFSGHQNNPEAANIGVYSVKSNEASEEYLKACIDLMEKVPEAHDQAVMQQVYGFLDRIENGETLEWGGQFEDQKTNLSFPTLQHRATHGRFSPFLIATDERPTASEKTLAIHTLCGAPLRNPHGKKMIAKELGAWYGSGSYYNAGNKFNNRYLWVDGHAWNGFSSAMSWPGYHPWVAYHDMNYLHWTVAATIALSRRTRRIWVMPKFLNDNGIHFLWTFLDMQSVEELVDVRETNFPVNPKAWHDSSRPFDPVARSALGDEGKIFVQLNAAEALVNSTGNILAWKPEAYETSGSPFDAWFAIHTMIPELADAQVLLAGLPVGKTLIETLQQKMENKVTLSIAESEVVEVWKKLLWCEAEPVAENIVGRTPADWDCYGQGRTLDN